MAIHLKAEHIKQQQLNDEQSASLPLPLSIGEPMAPISTDQLPVHPDWGFQLKWDGVRILASLAENGEVQLFSRKLLRKNNVYPEIVRTLSVHAAKLGQCLLDGEVVYWDGTKPNFQKVLQRERIGGNGSAKTAAIASSTEGENQGKLLYIVFDLLQDGDADLRSLPFIDRHERLHEKLGPLQSDKLLTTELYDDPVALWQWVEERQWEGIVGKRLSSPYREGKKHRDWLKKKTALLLDVGIVGVKRREGRAASLVMADPESGHFIGSVSLGLDEAMRDALGQMLQLYRSDAPSWPMPFASLPAELKGEDVVWLPSPMACRVTGLEMTSAGLLRHPKLVSFGAREGTSSRNGAQP
ncbi:DNA ligase [Paenibacillus sp. NEAU-GSW1]|uniref:ATP-dependent DNA ligase n=1 Tax=Paenibacillus sp. NEAU-GSW1 TaxID=2682486 RepID=UPI0012E21848|nr:DNA ligase [Paenibacillus sp. NEAU-GSW1]MUT67638.1 DNA ligase [Paenibacillus sp. NEAU-GSW1]